MTSPKALLTALLVFSVAAPAAAQPVFHAKERRITTDPSDQRDPAISGNLVVYTSFQNGDSDVVFYDLLTNRETPLVAEGNQELTDVSGGLITYTDLESFDVLVYSTTAGTSTNITSDSNGLALNPAISGTLVAWEDKREGNLEIYARDIATGVERRVSSNAAVDARPAVGGTIVVWESCAQSSCDIWAYDWTTGLTRNLTNTPDGSEQRPDISGDTVVYEGQRDGEVDVYAFDLQTGVEKRLSLPGEQKNANVSGRFAAFEDLADGVWRIRIWDLSSGEVFTATQGPGMQYLNDIDGNRVVYTDDRENQTDIYMVEFSVEYPSSEGTCRELRLEASKTYSPPLAQDATQTLFPPMRFGLPAEVPVLAGEAGRGSVTLSVTLGDGRVTCRYDGEGSRYVFGACDDGAVPGEQLVGSALALRVVDGDAKAGETRVALTLAEAQPCVGPNSDCANPGEAELLLDQSFVRGSGAPETVSATFGGRVGPGLLCVENGPADEASVTAGWVALNDTTLFSPRDWKKGGGNAIALHEKVWVLDEANTLTAKLAGAPGSTLRVRAYAAPVRMALPADAKVLFEDETVGCSQAGGGATFALGLCVLGLFAFGFRPTRAAVRIRSRR